MKRTYALAVAGLGMIATPLAAADLQVNIDGVTSESGAVMVALHRAVEGVEFPDEAGTVAAQWRNARDALRLSRPRARPIRGGRLP